MTDARLDIIKRVNQKRTRRENNAARHVDELLGEVGRLKAALMGENGSLRAGLYRHHPSGQHYLVLGVAGCHETGAKRAVYVSLETARPGPRLRTRLLDGPEGFDSHYPDGTKRFTFVGVEIWKDAQARD